MMPMGFEYGWSRRLSVVAGPDRLSGADREPARFDLSAFIAGVNRMKRAVPALNEEGPQRRVSRQDDPLLALLRQNESGAERVLTVVNTQEFEPREVAAEDLLASAGLSHLGNRIELAEMLPGGAEMPAPPGLVVAPLEVRVLRAVLRPTRQVVIAPYDRAPPDPGHHERWRPEARILIEDVWPQIDGGRYPVKRIVRDEIAVWADLLRDGHDTIAAVPEYPDYEQ